MVFREGVETVLLLAAVRLDTEGILNSAGILIGLALAILFGVAFVRGTIRINLRSFFKVTTGHPGGGGRATRPHRPARAVRVPGAPRAVQAEMRIIGPIVKSDVFFFVTILALAGSMILLEWRGRKAPAAAGLEGAALRKAKWTRTARAVSGWRHPAAATALFILAITAEFIYARSTSSLSPAVPVTAVNGFVRIPVATVNDGNLHRFSIEAEGVTVRMIVIRRPDQSLATAFDACAICGHQGYYQNGPNVICKNCASAIYVPTIGASGGCNPIPSSPAWKAMSSSYPPLTCWAAPAFSGHRLDMFLRFVSQSIRRSPRRKAMTVAAVAMGSAVATAMLGVRLDIGDRVNRELRSLGANLIVTPKGRSLPVEIGGISYRPLTHEDFIPEAAVPKIKTTFWHLNIIAVAPSLRAVAQVGGRAVPVDGVRFPDLRAVNRTWRVNGRWIEDPGRNEQDRRCMLGSALARRLGTRVRTAS